MFKAVSSAAILGTLFHPAIAQQAYHDLDADGVFGLPDSAIDTGRADEIYLEDSRRYEIYEHPRDPGLPTWHRASWQSWSVKFSGSSSLAFEGCWGPITAGTVGCPPERGVAAPSLSDRSELAVDTWKVGDDHHEVKFDKYRYVTFMLYIHPHTEVPSTGTLIHQVWQMGIKAPPPFAIWIQPEAGTGNWAAVPIELMFVLRNDATDPSLRYCNPEQAGATYATPAYGTDCPIEMFRIKVEKGQWNRFVIQLKPSLRDGQLAVWQNRTPAPGVRPDALYRGPWGYSAGMNEFDVRVGIYRRQQSRRLKLMFDDIRLGSTAASVQ